MKGGITEPLLKQFIEQEGLINHAHRFTEVIEGTTEDDAMRAGFDGVAMIVRVVEIGLHRGAANAEEQPEGRRANGTLLVGESPHVLRREMGGVQLARGPFNLRLR